MAKLGNPNWKKGVSPNPKGRPPIILPEVQRAIDANKNAFKVLILQKIEPKINVWLDQIIERGVNDGDVVKLKMLLEMVFGKIPEDNKHDDLTPQEKKIIEIYRERLALQHAAEGSSGDGGSSRESS